MTFEQANLDHIHYRAIFERAGDSTSADIMASIYADEIRHLRQGVRWFRHWKNPSLTDFDAHQQHLNLPLSMARAKGRSFDEHGRLAAGLSQDYVDQLQVTSVSKGRLPNVLLFWPNVEAHIAQPTQQLPAAALRLAQSLELLPIVQARHGDILLVHHEPSIDFLKPLQNCGLTLPQFVVWDGVHWPDPLKNRRIQAVRPWMGSRTFKSFPKKSKWRDAHRKTHTKTWSNTLLRAWSEQSTIEWGTQLDDIGLTCESMADVERAQDLSV